MLATGTHVLIRVKSNLILHRIGGFLPDGSYHSYLTGGGGRWCLKVRVMGPGNGGGPGRPGDVLPDHRPAVPRRLPGLPARRRLRLAVARIGNLLREAKSAIAGAGPSAGPIFRSRTPELIDQEHAAWICATELARALARAAARQAAPARKAATPASRSSPGRFLTAARRAALASIRSGAATASLPAAMTAALGRGTVHVLGKRRIVIDRHRHRDRKTKTRPAFPAAGRGIATRTAAAQVSVCAPAPA